MKAISIISLVFLSTTILASETYKEGILDLGLSLLDNEIVVYLGPRYTVEATSRAGANILNTAKAINTLQTELNNFGVAAAPTPADSGWVARKARYLCKAKYKEQLVPKFGGGEIIKSITIESIESCKVKAAEDTSFSGTPKIAISESTITKELTFKKTETKHPLSNAQKE